MWHLPEGNFTEKWEMWEYQDNWADQKNSLVSGPPTDPATTPPTVNFLQQSEQKVFFMAKKK